MVKGRVCRGKRMKNYRAQGVRKVPLRAIPNYLLTFLMASQGKDNDSEVVDKEFKGQGCIITWVVQDYDNPPCS